jgi:hypothetical protein
MRILGFFFERSDAAGLAAVRLHDADLDESLIRSAPLAFDGVDGTILALAVRDASCGTATAMAREHAGRLIADVAEEWTHSRSGSGSILR